jgi:nucleoside-diphosphate-sugar epimerase
MRILIIGGTILTGPFVVRQLHEMGHEVVIFHRGQHEVDLPPDVQHIHGDRQQLPEYAGEFRRFAPDVVLDNVALTEQHARTLMQTFRGLTRRVVVPSSIDVYRAYGRIHGTEPGPPEPVPLTEEAPLREKLTQVGESHEKRWVEREVMGDPELPGTVLRLPMIYGPGDYIHRLFAHLKRMDDRRPAILLPKGWAEQRASRGYAENMAAAIVLAVVDERATGRIYNVAEPEGFSLAEWVSRIGQAVGWSGDIVINPKLGIEPEAVQHWVVDTSRIRQELGYAEPIPLEDALRRTIEWERANPPDDAFRERFAQFEPGLTFDYAAEDTVLAELGWNDG